MCGRVEKLLGQTCVLVKWDNGVTIHLPNSALKRAIPIGGGRMQFTSPGAYYVFAPGFNFNPVKRGVPEPEPIVLPQNITDIAMKQEIVEGEREGSNTTITATIMAISPNDQFYEFSNISEENPVPSKTTQKNNILMAAQLGMKGPPPSGEQPVDKMFNSQLIKEISQHPALFDFTCDEYKSIEARNRNWDEVSSHSCQPLEFVRTRWKTLRDRFKKEVRRIKQQQLQQPENAFNGCWHHFEEMLFLLPFVRDKAEEVVSHSKDGKEL
uniref:MADF domain-containing protein n=1 Tax=Meloidogyne javanica TaxID=6303 RepID=A0A915M9I2_MELJA